MKKLFPVLYLPTTDIIDILSFIDYKNYIDSSDIVNLPLIY